MQHRQTVLLRGCAVGLSSAVVLAAALMPPPAPAQSLIAEARSEKASPFAAARDETNAPEAQVGDPTSASLKEGLKTLGGVKADGTKTNSPFAAAKESDAAARHALRADRARLWWLLLPTGLAAIGYGALRSQEGNAGA